MTGNGMETPRQQRDVAYKRPAILCRIGGRMKKTTIAALTLLVATTTFAADAIKRGAPVSSSKPVALTKVLETPKAYTKDAVVVEGVIEKSCSAKGCWMELAPAAGEKTVRVRSEERG